VDTVVATTLLPLHTAVDMELLLLLKLHMVPATVVVVVEATATPADPVVNPGGKSTNHTADPSSSTIFSSGIGLGWVTRRIMGILHFFPDQIFSFLSAMLFSFTTISLGFYNIESSGGSSALDETIRRTDLPLLR